MTAVNSILVYGGSLDGWMAAALLARSLPLTVTVLDTQPQESGVEATLPAITGFHHRLGLNERALIDNGIATPTLATHYRASDSWVPFEAPGFTLDGLPFHHYAVYGHLNGRLEAAFDAFSLPAQAARRQRYHPQSNDAGSLLATLNSGLQLDRDRYRSVIMALAKELGVHRRTGALLKVERAGDDVESLLLEDGERLSAELFVDADGALMSDAQKEQTERLASAEGFAVERLVAPQTEVACPCTRVTQREEGWELERGTAACVERLRLGAEDSPSEFGRYCPTPWMGNTLAVGQAAGELEAFVTGPLHWLQTAVVRLLDAFPASTDWRATRAEYNRRTLLEWRDRQAFFELHLYLAAHSQGASDVWRQRWHKVDNPELLRWLTLFQTAGLVASRELQALPDALRVSLLLGHQLWPQACDPQVSAREPAAVAHELAKMRQMIDRAATQLPPYP
ncbi:tryptophan 7-halogenase [Marinimicrobium agarilyticum]|uniref:tryptophan 7-halogenase n=1 Tax=Marinimicrobium agarilyticum TaxID=306546 RepID=UPI000484F211|nr:tryptophan 7-halogenase [Marinimicrobium agarilyticum]